MRSEDAAAGVRTPRVLTVGHSTHPLGEFLGLLHGAGVTRVVDVRTLPGSRRHPQFDAETLGPALEEAGIAYEHEPLLGGLRRASPDVDPAVNGFWENASFHRYADYALGDAFEAGLGRLIALAEPPELPAAMCAEAVWWRCHRRIIADRLLARGVPVGHLMPDGRVVEATLTPGALVRDERVTYPGDGATGRG